MEDSDEEGKKYYQQLKAKQKTFRLSKINGNTFNKRAWKTREGKQSRTRKYGKLPNGYKENIGLEKTTISYDPVITKKTLRDLKKLRKSLSKFRESL